MLKRNGSSVVSAYPRHLPEKWAVIIANSFSKTELPHNVTCHATLSPFAKNSCTKTTTRNVLLSTRGRASWLVYISKLKSIVLFMSSAAFFVSEEAALLALSFSLLLASLSFFSSSVSFLLLSVSFLFLLSNLALLFPALSDSPGRFLLLSIQSLSIRKRGCKTKSTSK